MSEVEGENRRAIVAGGEIKRKKKDKTFFSSVTLSRMQDRLC